MLFGVQSEYGLKHEQLISTTTDNGSNFVKAFREFGIADYVPDFSGLQDTMELDNLSTSDILYEEVLLVNNSEELETRGLYLPRHLRCASHTLSLLATTDLNNFIRGDSLISRIHYSAIAKCTLLWNMSRRPKSAEIIKDHLGHQLLYPCPTRWNSLYDAILHLMKSKTTLNGLFEKLGKPNTFSAVEFEYLEEFLEVLKPIASALDYLQGDNCYYGKLLPTLMSVKTKLERQRDSNLRHFPRVLPKLLESLGNRFEKFLQLTPEANEAILAACFHPAYKMRWLPESCPIEDKQRLQNLAITTLESASELPRSSSSSSKNEDDDFIVFADYTRDRPATSMELELVSFFNDKGKDLSVLQRYPNVRKMFIKFNTSLCSSGPVERLFSLAGFIHSPTRRNLSDNTFKNLVYMKGNSVFNS
ncbi:uncharacterized protein LOC134795215 [Cydia splendana]